MFQKVNSFFDSVIVIIRYVIKARNTQINYLKKYDYDRYFTGIKQKYL